MPAVARQRIARGVPAWLWVAWGAFALAAVAALRRRENRPAGLAGALITLLTVAFFRDPERTPEAQGILASADGRVVAVDRRDDGRWRVATYMSLRDVHVNRAPADAVVRSVEYRPGGHVPAFDKDSERNERLRWTVDTAEGEMEIIQIAGALARRIVPYRAPDEAIRRGERIGLIRFGSRVDVVLPLGIEPAVAVGDRLRAGESRLAR
ncbi:MAG: phosphatidylserine decarboxylase [Solirubrobacteraceae bacterium]|jgi:phosphatidylserine decarboxylase|nr:phosphatidylserine decarboxylase [Solirubrobacteraceae bacterium]